jgi:hypothetical protein
VRKSLIALAGVLAAMCIVAMPASAATKHLRLWSKEAFSKTYDQNGQLITDQNAPPPVGGYFITSDTDYRGNHKKHSKRPVATDHLICTFTEVSLNPFSLTALCDGQVALPGGMLLSDRQTVHFTDTGATFPLTGGTGRYAKVRGGQLVTTFYSENSSNSDLAITIRF